MNWFIKILVIVSMVGLCKPIPIDASSPQSERVNTFSPKAHQMNIPVIKQMPELPRGCEVTSLAMMLQAKGVHVDKMKLAKEVRKNPATYQVKGGKVYFGHPNEGFVGDMYTYKNPGLGVYHKPIHELAKSYVGDRAVDLTGADFERILEEVANSNPVWVIQNSHFNALPKHQWVTWHTPDGTIKVTYREHSVVITGFDEEYIYVNDPLTGEQNRRLVRSSFIKGWKQMGKQAIVIHDGNPEVLQFWQHAFKMK